MDCVYNSISIPLAEPRARTDEQMETFSPERTGRVHNVIYTRGRVIVCRRRPSRAFRRYTPTFCTYKDYVWLASKLPSSPSAAVFDLAGRKRENRTRIPARPTSWCLNRCRNVRTINVISVR